MKEGCSQFSWPLQKSSGEDPVFFDPDADTPQLLDPGHVLCGTLEAMLNAGIPPQLIYASYTTGFIVSASNKHSMPKSISMSGKTAIGEYFAFIDRLTRRSEPNSSEEKIHPPHPTTAIPELLAMELSEKAYRTVVEIVTAASRVQDEKLNPTGGPNLRWRIELAAAFFAAAIDHGYSAAEATEQDPEEMVDLTIDLCVRRAMEIWGQGGA